ncbi:site-specific integrase [Streptosporangium sp. NBC_01495]|uniref:site-specific integrase n=1 Tax=Streptosporangium sp. NBC_01495 TaxID=2903899 RepID=UPI002E35426C|nr:site-specific integrase [Streptosporangium sp. NBC_01495]
MLYLFIRGADVADWRVFWVPRDAVRGGVRRSVLKGWTDLAVREREIGVRAGDPIFLSPDYRVDAALCSYGRSKGFRACTQETRRNYATDICLLLDFLWSRGRGWAEARERDLEDFEHWRRVEESNPRRIGGSKWERELAAFMSLYRWAVKHQFVTRNPVATKQMLGRYGEVLMVAEARAKDARPSNVHWLTPRTWRLWIDVGLRGHSKEGIPESGWVGRVEDRNVAFVRLLVSSGLRRSEGGSLLTFEVPARRLDGGRYYRGKISTAVTRSKKTRTFYAASEAIGDIEAYVDSSPMTLPGGISPSTPSLAPNDAALPKATWITLILGGFAVMVMSGLLIGLSDGATFALMIVLMLWLMLDLVLMLSISFDTWFAETPGYADLHLSGRTADLIAHVRDALANGLTFGISGGLVVGLMYGLANGLVYGLAGGLGIGLGYGLIGGFIVGFMVGLADGMVKWAEQPASSTAATTPLTSWKADRTLTLLRAVTLGLAAGLPVGLLAGSSFGRLVGLAVGFEGGLTGGLAAGLTSGLAAGLMVGLSRGLNHGNHHAWLAYTIAIRRLAKKEHLPFTLMTFLDDAHRLGLLRTVGPIYQFRHAELQDHLAAPPSSSSEPADRATPPRSTENAA